MNPRWGIHTGVDFYNERDEVMNFWRLWKRLYRVSTIKKHKTLMIFLHFQKIAFSNVYLLSLSHFFSIYSMVSVNFCQEKCLKMTNF